MIEITDKYLPETEERMMFLQNRINENKKSIFGGKLEILTSKDNKPVVDQTEYMINQLINNIDIYEAELASLGK